MNRHNTKFKIAAVLALLVSTVTFNSGFANEASENQFAKIYHVYVANAYIGSVANEATVEEIVKQKELEASKQFKNMELDANANVSIIPEQVFAVETNEAQTVKDLQQAITVQAKAYSLQVGDTVVANLKAEEEIEAVIDGLKLQYVTPDELSQFKNNAITSYPHYKKMKPALLILRYLKISQRKKQW